MEAIRRLLCWLGFHRWERDEPSEEELGSHCARCGISRELGRRLRVDYSRFGRNGESYTTYLEERLEAAEQHRRK
jgi:hypothetical protein